MSEQEKGGDNMNDRTYQELRQEVKNDLMRMYPNVLLLTLEQAAKIYGFTDKYKAKRVIGAPRVPGEYRVMYYLGDIATDIAKRRIGNIR